MRLVANQKRKEAIIQSVIMSKTGPRISLMCSKLCMPLAFTAIAVLLAMHYYPTDEPKTLIFGAPRGDATSVVITALMWIGLGYAVRLCLRIAANNGASKDLGGRVEEDIIFTHNRLLYFFRPKYRSLPTERVVVCIPYAQLHCVSYDAALCKLTLRGRISSDLVENFDPSHVVLPRSGNLNEIVIYDYFTPDLCGTLISKGIIIQQRSSVYEQ